MTHFAIARPFLDRYREFIFYCSDTSPNYTNFMGLLLLGHAIGFNSINMLQPDMVHHNMYVLLLGESTMTRKSTSQRLARSCYNEEYSMPNQTSPESFVMKLHERSKRLYWMGEFTQLLKQITGNTYNAPMVEIMNDLYDCPNKYDRILMKKKNDDGNFAVTKPYLSACSTCTPAMLKQYLNEEMVYGGFLVRWLLVEGFPIETPRPRTRLDYRVPGQKTDLSNDLKLLSDLSTEGIVFEFTDEAIDLYNEINNQMIERFDNIQAFAGRYTDYIAKIADLMIVSDILTINSDPNPEIVETIKTFETFWQLAEFTFQKAVETTDTTDYTVLTDYISITKEHYNKRPAREYLDELYTCKALFNTFVKTHDKKTTHILVPSIYVKKAWELIEPVLLTARAMATYVSLDKPVAKLREFLERNAPISRSEAMTATHLNSKDMGLAVDTLTQMEFINPIIIRIQREKTNVQKTIYCLESYRNTSRCIKCQYRNTCWKESKNDDMMAEISIGGKKI